MKLLRAGHLFIISFLGFSICGVPILGDQTDFDCLRSIYGSIQDPYRYLSITWNLDKTTGSICHFVGVECWHQDDEKVLSIKLVNMGLRGSFPLGLANCKSLTGLDLSQNNFSGPLPTNISSVVGSLASLVLSSNNFSGQIPPDIGRCKFLNVLELDNNRFSGQIPQELNSLPRIKTFNVSNNFLSGPILDLQNGTSADFSNNPGLCGGPLRRCSKPSASGSHGVEPYLVTGSALLGLTAIALVVCAVLIFRYYASR